LTMDDINFEQLSKDQTRIFNLVGSNQFQDVLMKSRNDPNSQLAATADFRGFLRDNGVAISDDFGVKFKPNTWSVCVNLGVISVCYSR
jgi:hypothetical protein